MRVCACLHTGSWGGAPGEGRRGGWGGLGSEAGFPWRPGSERVGPSEVTPPVRPAPAPRGPAGSLSGTEALPPPRPPAQGTRGSRPWAACVWAVGMCFPPRPGRSARCQTRVPGAPGSASVFPRLRTAACAPPSASGWGRSPAALPPEPRPPTRSPAGLPGLGASRAGRALGVPPWQPLLCDPGLRLLPWKQGSLLAGRMNLGQGQWVQGSRGCGHHLPGGPALESPDTAVPPASVDSEKPRETGGSRGARVGPGALQAGG